MFFLFLEKVDGNFVHPILWTLSPIEHMKWCEGTRLKKAGTALVEFADGAGFVVRYSQWCDTVSRSPDRPEEREK